MVFWFLAVVSFYFGATGLARSFDLKNRVGAFAREKNRLKRVSLLLRELEEILQAGMTPSLAEWERLKDLPHPWGGLAWESLQKLRQQGGALLPTLRRLRALADEHAVSLKDAHARSAQALAQAAACAAMVPLFGTALYFLMPGVEEKPWIWFSGCLIAVGGSGMGALWMLSYAEKARWGGLPSRARHWVLSAQCAGERFLAMVRSGTPPDLAWVSACESLSRDAVELAQIWGFSLWKTEPIRAPANTGSLAQAGESIRKAVQVSLMEGQGCAERVEAALLSLRHDFKAQVDRELSVLPTRALKPLFFCVAPALFGLLGLGFWIGWKGVFV